jgi:hypothetical protein
LPLALPYSSVSGYKPGFINEPKGIEMATKGKKAAAMTIDMALLAALCAATASATGAMHVSEAAITPLVHEGLAEVNPDPSTKAPNGDLLARSTAKGDEMNSKAQAQTGSTPAATPAAPAASKFAVVAGVPMPETQRKGFARGEQYPFSTLEVGQSFFIPATTDKPQPERSYASTVASARNRYSVADPAGATRTNRKGKTVPVVTYSRDFAIRGGVEGTPYGQPGVKGAAIWRTR